MIEAEHFKAQNQTVFDAINRLTDIGNIPAEKRRRYVTLAYRQLIGDEFDNDVEQLNRDDSQLALRLGMIMEAISRWVETESSIDKYWAMLNEDEFFDRFIANLRENLASAADRFSVTAVTDFVADLVTEHLSQNKPASPEAETD